MTDLTIIKRNFADDMHVAYFDNNEAVVSYISEAIMAYDDKVLEALRQHSNGEPIDITKVYRDIVMRAIEDDIDGDDRDELEDARRVFGI